MVEVLCEFPKLIMSVLDKLTGRKHEVRIMKRTTLVASTPNIHMAAYEVF
jgi:vacuolar-type H+-ATPase catalytic subunit A/Vma1